MHKKAKGTMEDFPILHIIVDKKITPMKTYCFHWHFYLYMLYDYYPFKRLPTTTPTIPTPKPIKAIINKNKKKRLIKINLFIYCSLKLFSYYINSDFCANFAVKFNSNFNCTKFFDSFFKSDSTFVNANALFF